MVGIEGKNFQREISLQILRQNNTLRAGMTASNTSLIHLLPSERGSNNDYQY